MTTHTAYCPPARQRLRSSFGALLLAAALPGGALAADFDVEITGFADDIGQAAVELYASQGAYESRRPDALHAAPIVARKARLRINGLDGAFALIAYHDRDSDGRQRTLPFRIPIDATGYSQGAWRAFNSPDWVLASFSSDIEPPLQLIRLRTNAFVAFGQMMAIGLPVLLTVFVGLGIIRRIRLAFTQTRKADPS